ncbi:MAG: methyl-accepting chemotaxis protein [Herpetosiphonaceae bacterium]|nr:MAG: methyl-accepting chemotaxis protein [Herpetosiphonaceae bacterium]
MAQASPFRDMAMLGSDDPNAREHQQSLLTFISLGIAGVSLVIVVALAVLRWRYGISDLKWLMMVAAFGIPVGGVGFYLARRSYVERAAQVDAIGLTLMMLSATHTFEGINGPLPFVGAVIILAIGLLGSRGLALTVGSISALGYIFLFLLELFNIWPPIQIEVQNPQAAVLYSGILLVGTLGIVIYLSIFFATSLRRSVELARERTSQIVATNEQLMEKNLLQIELGSQLSSAAAQVSAASQQQASGATEQASAVSQVSSTIEELGYTARQIALSADQVREAAQQTLDSLGQGQQAVDESIRGMERIKARVQDVATRVLGLGERSQQIGEIIDLIDDIADETHLLALNAAIEAAGAGEHGRRFAVVAAEVKNLANRALNAAREVKGVIAEIQTATNSSVMATEESVKEVEKGLELARRAGEVMDMVLMMAERTASAAQEISLATSQQQTASEQVVETMREIAEVSRQAAAGSRQMAQAAATLTAIAERLHGIASADVVQQPAVNGRERELREHELYVRS